MERKYNLDEIEEYISEKIKFTEDELKAYEFFKLLGKSKVSSEKDPCLEDEEDCSDFLSNCCNSVMTTVFGTQPLEVKCSNCNQNYILRDLLSE